MGLRQSWSIKAAGSGFEETVSLPLTAVPQDIGVVPAQHLRARRRETERAVNVIGVRSVERVPGP